MSRGEEGLLIVMVAFFLIYLVAFALFAGIASLAKINWRIAGIIGIVTALVLLMVNIRDPDAFPWLLIPALCLFAVVGFTMLWWNIKS